MPQGSVALSGTAVSVKLRHTLAEAQRPSFLPLANWRLGSSLHRGRWAASFFNDYVAAQDNTVMQSLVLTGGIKGWVAGKGEFVEYMHEYNELKW